MIKITSIKKDYTPTLLKDLQVAALSFVTQGGQEIQAKSASLSPVRTGNLRSSIKTESYVEDGKPVSETGPTAEYAVHVEYGTARSKAQPFMENGYQAAIPRINQLKRDLLDAK